jgi:hypothetical protein
MSEIRDTQYQGGEKKKETKESLGIKEKEEESRRN